LPWKRCQSPFLKKTTWLFFHSGIMYSVHFKGRGCGAVALIPSLWRNCDWIAFLALPGERDGVDATGRRGVLHLAGLGRHGVRGEFFVCS
jgi:hypothetical protein